MKRLPNIHTIQELSYLLGVSDKELIAFANQIHKFSYNKPRLGKDGKPKGNMRVPHKPLKAILQKINKHVLFSLRPKGSIKTNAMLHAGAEVVGNLDIKDFFPSVRSHRVMDLFTTLGIIPEVAVLLTRLTTYRDRLPIGFPTSSYIANGILLSIMEKRFKNLCDYHGLKVSFYVDDITISGNYRVEKLKNLFTKIIGQEGFLVNPDKIDFSDKRNRQEVTGLVINSGRPNVPKDYVQNLRAVIHNCVKNGPLIQMKKFKELRQRSKQVKDLESFRESLKGMISYVMGINHDRGQKLLLDFNRINWTL